MTDQPKYKHLVRIQRERKIAGVCAGLGAYFEIDPIVFRILCVATALAGGSGILFYIIAWIMMPLSEES